MTGEFLPLSNDSLCCFQHIFYKDSVASGWVIHQHMGHRAHQLPILNDRTAAHALDDAAGGGEQLFIRDLQ